jgi:hypothetical protein
MSLCVVHILLNEMKYNSPKKRATVHVKVTMLKQKLTLMLHRKKSFVLYLILTKLYLSQILNYGN